MGTGWLGRRFGPHPSQPVPSCRMIKHVVVNCQNCHDVSGGHLHCFCFYYCTQPAETRRNLVVYAWKQHNKQVKVAQYCRSNRSNDTKTTRGGEQTASSAAFTPLAAILKCQLGAVQVPTLLPSWNSANRVRFWWHSQLGSLKIKLPVSALFSNWSVLCASMDCVVLYILPGTNNRNNGEDDDAVHSVLYWSLIGKASFSQFTVRWVGDLMQFTDQLLE